MNADPTGKALLSLAAEGDSALLCRWCKRLEEGIPAPYLCGFQIFRGQRYLSDRRAYVTDPELSFLVDLVLEEGDAHTRTYGQPPHVLEFGTGAGTLLIAIALERPNWQCSGLDIDPAALELASENARLHGVEIDLRESNFFSAWTGGLQPPTLVFGDPPWGTATDLYVDERDSRYYEQMPTMSAFPATGGRTGIHDELLRQWVKLPWKALLLLNYGILPRDVIAQSATPLRDWEIVQPQPGLSVLKTWNKGLVDK